MVEQVVGLEFITKGAERATRDITEYSRSTQLASKTASDLTIRLNDEAKVFIKQARIYQDNTKYIQKINQLFIENARASQEIVNAATGVTNSYKSAADSMDVFAAQIDRVEQANLKVAQSFGEAVREANTYEMANKSAADSAEVFAAQIDRVEQANLKVAQSFGEAVRAANTYDLANKSAADSADVFAQELQRSEQIMRDQARAFGEAVREANTYQTANKSAAASAEIFSRELRKQEAQASDTARAHQEHIRALYQSNLANKSAADSAEVFARAMQIEEAERIKLERTYNRTAAAARVYEHTVENLNRAEKLGVISASQKAAELARLENAYLQVGRSTAHANTFINQFGDGVRVAGIKTNRFGLYAQQVGYQVGDFFVQIQSGTNAFVAFGQQATQLAGLLPGLAGAIVGISISVATMFLSAWSRAKQAAEDTTDTFNELGSAINELENYSIELVESNERIISSFDGILNIVKEVKQEALQAKLGEILMPYEEQIRSFEQRMAVFMRLGGEKPGFKAPEFEGMGFDDIGRGVQAYELLRGIQGETREELLESVRMTELWLRGSGLLTDEIKKILAAYADAIGLSDALTEGSKVQEGLEKSRLKSIELYYDNLEKAANLEKENADAVTEIIKNRDAAVATLQEELILSQTILKYGKDSEQVAILKASNERAAFMEQAKQQRILGKNLEIVMALYDQNVKVSNEVEAASEKAKEFAEALKEASSAMASLSGFSANLDRELAVATAKVEALRQGADATIAGNIAGMRADLERRMGEAVAAGVDRGIVERQFGGERARISQLEGLRQEEKRLGERGRGGAGGAGGAAQGDYLSQLQKEAELKLRLIGLTDEQRRYEEIAAELSERGLPVEEQRIQAIIATEQALQQATNAEERRQEIMQAVTGNIETALMGLVEGTSSVEDAFKSMMRNIILEVYRQQVAKPFADAIGSFFFANGAAFQGGNVVPFANGGVVGGPTTFPMSGGRTGLMGEAGPEAIMPLKRGKDGKLGVVAEGGGAVNITQNFNISANGDDSVKRIVQQQIPRIAEATKAAVVDAKRRGGAYGKAFA